MKLSYLLIGLVLGLMLCISPVAAVSADDFIIKIDESDRVDFPAYTYLNVNDPNEKYIEIYTGGTWILDSFVTFKPRNIPDAITMVVDTCDDRWIHLPLSVDDWEIKYYSASDPEFVGPDPKYLKNAGVVNLISFFGKEISRGHWLELEISAGQYIWCPHGFPFSNVYHIPDVD